MGKHYRQAMSWVDKQRESMSVDVSALAPLPGRLIVRLTQLTAPKKSVIITPVSAEKQLYEGVVVAMDPEPSHEAVDAGVQEGSKVWFSYNVQADDSIFLEDPLAGKHALIPTDAVLAVAVPV